MLSTPTYASHRKTAVVVGLLFILCTAASILSAIITAGLLDAPNYLTLLAAHDGRMVAGALAEFVWAVSAAGIAIGLYPVLRKHNRAVALGALAARTVEGALVLVGMIGLLTLLSVSQEIVAGAADASSFEAVGSSLLAARDWTHGYVMVLAWLAGAFMYYCLLYKARLVPRWLSGWGLVGAALCLGATVYSGFTQQLGFTPVNLAANLLIFAQEIALGVWLIAKGFNPATLTSEALVPEQDDKTFLAASVTGQAA
jgi:hypothetical protein